MAQQKNFSDVKEKDIENQFKEYQQRIDKFEKDIGEFPTENNNILNLEKNKKDIYRHMYQCYPLMHGSVLSLIHHFLLIKRKYGTKIEKDLYENMKVTDFIHRLATKRCVVFYQNYDSYLLRNGYNDAGKWELIGTEDENKKSKYDTQPEKKPKLAEYLSYDELIISALCGISSPTHFINNGSRRNCGRLPDDEDEYPFEGVYMGLVGSRFEKTNYMEYALMAITQDQNVEDNGYGACTKDDEKNHSFCDQEQKLDIEYELNDDEFMKTVDAAEKARKQNMEKKSECTSLDCF